MKNYSIILSIGILIAIIIFSCKKEDNVRPVVILKGNDTVTMKLNSTYSDPGFNATDDTDGNLTENVAMNSKINPDKVGFYDVYYTVSDEAGNVSDSKHRAVFVYNEAYVYVDTWTGNDSLLYPQKTTNPFDVDINIDSTLNNKIIFSRLESDIEAPVYGLISGPGIELPLQDSKYNDSLSIKYQGHGKIKNERVTLHFGRYTDSTSTFKYLNLTRSVPEE